MAGECVWLMYNVDICAVKLSDSCGFRMPVGQRSQQTCRGKEDGTAGYRMRKRMEELARNMQIAGNTSLRSST